MKCYNIYWYNLLKLARFVILVVSSTYQTIQVCFFLLGLVYLITLVFHWTCVVTVDYYNDTNALTYYYY